MRHKKYIPHNFQKERLYSALRSGFRGTALVNEGFKPSQISNAIVDLELNVEPFRTQSVKSIYLKSPEESKAIAVITHKYFPIIKDKLKAALEIVSIAEIKKLNVTEVYVIMSHIIDVINYGCSIDTFVCESCGFFNFDARYQNKKKISRTCDRCNHKQINRARNY